MPIVNKKRKHESRVTVHKLVSNRNASIAKINTDNDGICNFYNTIFKESDIMKEMSDASIEFCDDYTTGTVCDFEILKNVVFKMKNAYMKWKCGFDSDEEIKEAEKKPLVRDVKKFLNSHRNIAKACSDDVHREFIKEAATMKMTMVDKLQTAITVMIKEFNENNYTPLVVAVNQSAAAINLSSDEMWDKLSYESDYKYWKETIYTDNDDFKTIHVIEAVEGTGVTSQSDEVPDVSQVSLGSIDELL